MQRDMDMIRDLLLEIEAGKTSFKVVSSETDRMLGIADDGDAFSDQDAAKLKYHLELLEQRHLVEIKFKSLAGTWSMASLTWDGHEFIAAIRDDEIWEQTKFVAKKGGLASLEALWKIATEVAKGYVKQRTGLDI